MTKYPDTPQLVGRWSCCVVLENTLLVVALSLPLPYVLS